MASRQAWVGAQGVLLPSRPATAEGRVDRAARPPCDAAVQTNSSVPEDEKEPGNVTSHMKKNVTVLVLVLLCSVRCQEGVETHRWSGWFPLSEIWVRARAQISGPHS
ncbi:unnamed protein product [Pleuronectes platessa]|uniref:Uncharacterized protein n=1 Tax=Pleuronectes platessa TaxID=8262 RepID=A0A9N7Y700_PLEPL|nr:unnamed protein product [Pleuronectes platessa]